MKKIFFLFFLFGILDVSAQNNQIKVDLLDVLALRTFDISYENQLNNEASVGVSMFFNFEPKDSNFRYHEDFQITPYFRQFITESRGFDVFGELFGSLNFAETKKDANGSTQNYSDFALGLGLGIKHISQNGYIFEINTGLGRNLFNSQVSREFVQRHGISIGKQF
ncbi:MAG: DUF3575 domain-containing protein [Wenyingzhuangia sp.]|jgi:hypothetical protein|uniref:DUF3575 domain-containing protein n=1 Tax=Wenyingzhuangia sp. TaxID=1964193 RepID=UPI003219E03D